MILPRIFSQLFRVLCIFIVIVVIANAYPLIRLPRLASVRAPPHAALGECDARMWEMEKFHSINVLFSIRFVR